ncbi:tetratricopeptide repeat protein [Nonomuraea sp. NPDC049421]|uniref:tetratricopeptide repeat protein n=1 Tax=Nonomuraea sp. NPDC049421 TaxID=3155275 RepID=UPI00342A7C0E
MLTAAALLLLVGGAALFFLGNPLGLPPAVLNVLDQRASVISMVIGLVLGSAALWLQLRSPTGGSAAPKVATSGTQAPAVNTMSGGLVIGAHIGSLISDERSLAISGQVGMVITGDVHGDVRVEPPREPAPQALDGLLAAPVDFTGRARALQDLAAFLKVASVGGAAAAGPGSTAAVTCAAVAGMAGVGKTALALVSAHNAQSQGWFPGGIFFMNLHGYSPDGSKPVSALAAAGQLLRRLGVPAEKLPVGEEEVFTAYHSVLAERATDGQAVLVVADNVVESDQIAPLVPTQACHRLLVTSRHTLSLTARQLDLDVLDKAEAVELLQRALQVRRPDERVADDRTAAAAIVELGGRLPLAVQIIAALLAAEPDRPLAAMASELAEVGERLNVIAALGTSPDRPIAVRASFDLSYQRLTRHHPDRARLFRLLASAPGIDLSTEAAAAYDGRPLSQVRRELLELTVAHLLTGDPGERWSMHNLVRLHAGEQAVQHTMDDAQADALERLLNYYHQIAEAAVSHILSRPSGEAGKRFTGHAQALTWLDAERHNLVTTITSLRHPRYLPYARDLAGIIAPYLNWRRYLDDQLAVAHAALDACRELGDRHGEGPALNNLGNALREGGHFEEAITAHQGAAAIFRELGDRHGEGRALGNLGNALREGGHFEEAITAHQGAAAIFRELDNRHDEGRALGNLGIALREVRRFEEAITTHQQDLDICRGLGDRHGEGRALGNLGIALREVRRFEEAIIVGRSAAVIFRELGDQHNEGQALICLGNALQDVRRFDEAITAFEQAVSIFDTTKDDQNRATAQANLAEAEQQQADE